MKLSRRRFLTFAGVAGVTGAGLALDAFGPEARHVELTRHDLPVAGLAPALDGLKVAHLTDLHLPANRHAVDAMLALLAVERPDVVVITGDAVESRGGIPELIAFAREARGSRATFATLGNWERSGGIQPAEAAAAYSRAGVQFLLNESAAVRVGDASLSILGLDDPCLGKPNPERALRDAAAGPGIWLVHAPGIADALPASLPKPEVILAGHTHGGQIRLPFVPALTPPHSGRFVAGWYRDAFAPLYVSRGIGTTAVRARFRCSAELPLFTLRRA